ncbi:hypothetical protein HU200_066319 [Digitaria exilis]|uniref:F-box domain-containing protein n=1 Tax=Digitaria exilis TaxID=1010633 RepID=A0A834ZYE7_9POAL|nr:hypothetical protein HU200_066319 [Digitaria exilis]
MAALVGNKRRSRPLVVVTNDSMLLPAELLSEVLLRLPADELYRLRLVCRAWRSLTSGPTLRQGPPPARRRFPPHQH